MAEKSPNISKAAFALMIRKLAVLVPKYAPKFEDPSAVEAWFEAFEGFDAKKLGETFKALRDVCSEFPSIKDIKDMYKVVGGKVVEKKSIVLASDAKMLELQKMMEQKVIAVKK